MRCHSLRLITANGSRLRVGTRRSRKLRTDLYAFAMFLPGAELTLHAAFHPTDGAEWQMLFETLDVLPPRTDLLPFDRSYIDKTMVAALAEREIPLCMRVAGNALVLSPAAAKPSAW